MPPMPAAVHPARRVARLVGIFHNISYYAPEMKAFAELGLPEYWRAYMAYRSAPMGVVEPSTVAAVFYNFAPRMVGAGLPSAWESTTPTEVIALRDECIDRALRRALGNLAAGPDLAAMAVLVRDAVDDLDASGRALFAAHQQLPWPTDPLQALWHGCTLWREYRGDGHNIALAAAAIDGLECHVLLAAKGVGDRDTIMKIRGWTADEWAAAMERLADRQILDGDGQFTPAGRELRATIESHTDDLAAAPCNRIGESGVSQLTEMMGPLVEHLVATGAVAGRWPPRESATSDGPNRRA